MQLEEVTFDIKVYKSSSFDGNETEFEKFVSQLSPNIKFRTTINYKAQDESATEKVILFDREQTKLYNTHIAKKFRIMATSKEFYIKFYKPFIYTNPTKKYKAVDTWAKIEKIEITNIKAKYRNTEIYFCPFRQFVNTASECDNGRILDLSTGSGVYHICTNVEHRIGPDIINGGFYTEEDCSASCLEYKDCKVTYDHYANISPTTLYKAHVGCVDNEQNAGCSEELCKDYFADGEKRPINESVIQNDNIRVYTVKNKTLTGEMRPKINYDEEINSMTTNYEETFQTEMKDAAFKSMVDHQSYDRIEYLIGTPSPTKLAYNRTIAGSATKLRTLIKPSSYDFDNGITYRLYQVLKFEQAYKPAFGIFTVDNHLVNAKTQSIEFKDETFMVKQSDGTWKVFRQVNYAKVKQVKEKLVCENSSGGYDTTDYVTDTYIPDSCRRQTQIIWAELPSYRQERNVFYNPTTDSFANYSSSETVPSFSQQEWNSDLVINEYLVTNNLFSDLDNTPGAMIRSQVEKNNGSSFGRMYKDDFIGSQRGYPANIFLYTFYADHDLTYGEINDFLKNKNIAWELANQQKYRSQIDDDGEVSNNIRPLIVGNKNKTTVDLEITPKYTEEGQRVFKFMFLFDPAIKDPFSDDD
jgi:hypothetical protein